MHERLGKSLARVVPLVLLIALPAQGLAHCGVAFSGLLAHDHHAALAPAPMPAAHPHPAGPTGHKGNVSSKSVDRVVPQQETASCTLSELLFKTGRGADELTIVVLAGASCALPAPWRPVSDGFSPCPSAPLPLPDRAAAPLPLRI